MISRPAIPIEMRRQVLVEAGHRCAIQTCRNSSNIDLHHITPWKQCEEHAVDNLIALCPNCHRMADDGKIDRKSLRKYKEICRKTLDPVARHEINSVHAHIKFNPNVSTEIMNSKNMSSFTDIGILNFRFGFAKPFKDDIYVVNAMADGTIVYQVIYKSIETIQIKFDAPCSNIVRLEFQY